MPRVRRQALLGISFSGYWLKAVVVGHAYYVPRNVIGSAPALDQHVGGSLRCRIRIRRHQHVGFAVLALSNIAIDLVGADLYETRPCGCLLRARQLKQILDAQEVGYAEILGVRDSLVDVALGGKVQDHVALRQEVKRADVCFLKSIVWKLRELLHDSAVGRIADIVDVSDEPALLEAPAHEMFADEAETTGYDKDLRLLHEIRQPTEAALHLRMHSAVTAAPAVVHLVPSLAPVEQTSDTSSSSPAH